MFWNYLGWIASFLTALQLLPQTALLVRTKDLREISTQTFSIIFIASSLWILYGIHLKDGAIIFANIVTLSCSFLILNLKFFHHTYRKRISQKTE